MQLDLGTSKALAAKLSAVKTYGHFINGKWVDGHSGQTIELTNPATRQTLAHIQSGDAVDVDRAVNAAYDAFPKWSRSSPAQRQTVLRAIADRLRARQLEYAMMDTLNNGKTITEAYTHDITGAIGLFEYYAGAAFHLHGEVADFADSTMITHREPIGVVAQIIPWNVPLMMAALKLAPALTAGCTVVLKPAETVCVSVLEFIKDIADVLPPGVINVVTGYGHIVGEPLVTHPKVRKVAFTGSRGTAQKIMNYAAVNIIPQTLELGGKSANIVCEDADLDAAAESVVITTIFNKGEVCLAGSRVFVHKKVREEFVDKLTRLFAKVKQGDPTDPATRLGAQSSKAQYDRVLSYIEQGKKEGASVLVGGGPASIRGLENGLFIQPTIFTDVRNDMVIAQEEIFGPVTDLFTWEDEADMLSMVNDNIYGLGGGLWTRNLNRAHRISRAMETGMVWVNRYYNFKPGQPIGGVKQSGFGRESTFETLMHYTNTKSVVINLEEGGYGDFHAPPPNAFV
ncbi:acyl-CoA reductase-like NAD-dependent aldehyde dehydrogenase [Luteibacter sp. Sphag1AF]|uniref:aldehyde dehydrogenase family protein n=1 Tax=Luteibacter sp. Sphag1AF TaxID=2587031 RepID=UPI00160B1C74|nr:aldehyde dehydrogenase family protein [Luteibacter sp. Sphag1AF]MBB3228216.1 acyl-CoA reductase-like NAD-dependent aldehyde dehydrogenase [Luteibacter sp. Sphag1AF]